MDANATWSSSDYGGLSFTGTKAMGERLEQLLEVAGASLEWVGVKPVKAGSVRRDLVCRREGEEMRIQVWEDAQFARLVHVVLEIPVVARAAFLTAETLRALREHGWSEGAPDEQRCACGYCVANNESGRCPECGRAVTKLH